MPNPYSFVPLLDPRYTALLLIVTSSDSYPEPTCHITFPVPIITLVAGPSGRGFRKKLIQIACVQGTRIEAESGLLYLWQAVVR